MKPIRNVLIVGGGTAGWLTASFLAQTLGASQPGADVAITLIESSEIGIIGVGEGSFPSIKGTLSTVGIDEARFIRDCHATFKQGIHFANWVREPGQPGADHYFHPFSLPSQRAGAPELLPYWLMGAAGADLPFARATTLQKAVVDASRGPKRAGDADFLGPMNYAYHFDAGLLANLLAKRARELGVRHLLGNVEHVSLDDQGAIASVHTKEFGALTADLYIDCTGFRAALIGDVLGSPWHGTEDILFNDRALAMQVPYPEAHSPIPSYTIATAREAGWIWDIGLHDRRGTGYVYSSRHTSDERAEAVLRDYLGPVAEGRNPRLLKLRIGYREKPWVKNCVAIGLAGGFLEPLESSGIGLIETAAYMVSYLFPFDRNLEPAAQRFNHMMTARYERIVEFIKMHYALSKRADTPFWRDNTSPQSIPASLSEKLAMWRHRPPHRLDFVADYEMYQAASWQFVLYGMEFKTELHLAGYSRLDEARREFAAIAQLSPRAVADLPDHRQLVRHLCERAGVPTQAVAA